MPTAFSWINAHALSKVAGFGCLVIVCVVGIFVPLAIKYITLITGKQTAAVPNYEKTGMRKT
jgi:hypothetical protein